MTAVTLDQIPTLTTLYTSNKLTPSPSATVSPKQSINDRVSLYQGDITKLSLDAIVNAANKYLLGGGGVDGAIHAAAGRGLLEECSKLNGCPTGSAKITNGYELPARHVIHAVGPRYSELHAERHLEGCYRKSLALCREHGLKSVGFSAISTGIYGYPSREAAEVACRVVREVLEGEDGEGIESVVFVTFLQKDQMAYEKLLPKYFPPESSSGEAKAE